MRGTQPAHQAQQLRGVPLTSTDRPVGDAPRGIDDVGGRQATHRPLRDHRAVVIEQQREGHRVVGGERENDLLVLADVDREHRHVGGVQQRVGPFHRRQLVAARRAPGGPEVDDHRAAAQVAQAVRRAVHVDQREIGRVGTRFQRREGLPLGAANDTRGPDQHAGQQQPCGRRSPHGRSPAQRRSDSDDAPARCPRNGPDRQVERIDHRRLRCRCVAQTLTPHRLTEDGEPV